MRLSRDRSLGGWLSTAICSKGEALLLQGQFDEGKALLEEGMAMNQSLNIVMHFPHMLQLLAEAQGLQGDLDHAWINLSKAIKILGQTDERHWGSPLYRTRASLYSLQGDLEKAEIDLRKAIDIAHRRSAKSWELQAAIDMARLRHEQGRLEEARAGLLDVYSWFSEGFDTPDLKQARKLLQSLDAQ
jgi:ATP/maltotriose-dependent transcriptional regulator MalT